MVTTTYNRTSPIRRVGVSGHMRIHSGNNQNGKNAGCYSAVYAWFSRNESKLLQVNVISIAVLAVMHIFTTSIQIFPPILLSTLQIVTIVSISLIALSVIWKGIVPIIICIMGITLIHGAIIIPSLTDSIVGEGSFKSGKFFATDESVLIAARMYFFLGLAMVAMSLIVAYRPSMLFIKNRPESLDSVWSKYPIWYDNAKLVGGYEEQSVPVTRLMTDKDRYLLWRYEYVLASIYGTPHLVKPNGRVPLNSEIVRDKGSGRVMGKAKYSGFFA